MGDSSWVIIAYDPMIALAIHGVLFVTGVVVGYVVHVLGISPPVRARADADADAAAPAATCCRPTGRATPRPAMAILRRADSTPGTTRVVTAAPAPRRPGNGSTLALTGEGWPTSGWPR